MLKIGIAMFWGFSFYSYDIYANNVLYIEKYLPGPEGRVQKIDIH